MSRNMLKLSLIAEKSLMYVCEKGCFGNVSKGTFSVSRKLSEKWVFMLIIREILRGILSRNTLKLILIVERNGSCMYVCEKGYFWNVSKPTFSGLKNVLNMGFKILYDDFCLT